MKYNINIKKERDNLLTEFGKVTLKDRYLLPEESYQDLFARVSFAYADSQEHAQRLYDYMSQHWFMPATPVLSNGGTTRGIPVSCYLSEVEDTLEDIAGMWNENVWLGAKGGGIGNYWGNLRSIGEKVGQNGKTSGIIPFMKVVDSMTLAISQGSMRRSSTAAYLPIWHPEIEEFIDMRKPNGGDVNRKCLNLNHGVVISDEFMEAVKGNKKWALRSPKDNSVIDEVSARNLWIKILTTRLETGEPYLLFIDSVSQKRPKIYKNLNLYVKTSNLCSEIVLHTGKDHLESKRTAVCCLSSLNLEYWDHWKDNPIFIDDIMRFLDNVLQDFIDRAPSEMPKAKYSAMRERSVGLGVMGFHGFLQSKGVSFGSAVAKSWNKKIFAYIKDSVDKASEELAEEKGPALDALDAGIKARFTHKTAIAPTASISVIAGESSPGIDPITANIYTQKTLSGNFGVRNKHLIVLLETKEKNIPEVWSSIVANLGSVQHLDFLSEHEKEIFKTAFEIDQRWIIEHAADRTPFIDQSQSVNLFLPSDIEKKTLNKIHMLAWERGLKSLYYCRSMAINRADVASQLVELKVRSDECLACQ